MKVKRSMLVILSIILFAALTACSVLPSFSMLERLLTGNGTADQVAEPIEKEEAVLSQTEETNDNETGQYQSIEEAYINIYEDVNPAVVHIRVVDNDGETINQMPEFQFPGIPEIPNMPQGIIPSQSIGSGFIIDKEGHIVTNNHVVSGAERIVVTFYDGTEVKAELVGTDTNADLAVIKVEVAPDDLTVVPLGSSADLKVGQITVAIGNPFGLKSSMTTGIVSGLGRMLDASQSLTSTGSTYSIPDIIQTDTAINPGNSGGPLLDLDGTVIGVNTAIQSASGANSGVGYAVPVDIVKRIVPQLIEDGKVAYPWIGISGTTINADLSEAMDLDPGQKGVLVAEVVDDSPAEKAGLKGSSTTVKVDGYDVTVGGDVITAVDGRDVRVFDDLLGYLVMNTSVGDTIELQILRDGKEMTVELELEARPTNE